MRWTERLATITQRQTGFRGWVMALVIFLAAFALR
jgi:hypothetical protein